MGESVHRDGLDPGVTQPRFRRTGHGRVAPLRRFQIARQHGPEPGNGKHDCVFQHGVGAGETTQGGPQANPQQIKGLLPGRVSGLPKRDPLQRAREQQGQYRVQHASRFGRGRARIPGLAAGKFVPIVQWVVGRHAGGIVRLLVVGGSPMAEEHLDLDGLRAELNRYPEGTPMDVLYGLLQRVQSLVKMSLRASVLVTRNMSGTHLLGSRLGTRLYLLATWANQSGARPSRQWLWHLGVARHPDGDRLRDHQRWPHGQDGKP